MWPSRPRSRLSGLMSRYVSDYGDAVPLFVLSSMRTCCAHPAPAAAMSGPRKRDALKVGHGLPCVPESLAWRSSQVQRNRKPQTRAIFVYSPASFLFLPFNGTYLCDDPQQCAGSGPRARGHSGSATVCAVGCRAEEMGEKSTFDRSQSTGASCTGAVAHSRRRGRRVCAFQNAY